MKKIIIFALLAFSAAAATAQTNPKPGYIITNDGDTVRGNIDFRTNERMSKQCDFWADGGNEGKLILYTETFTIDMRNNSNLCIH